MPTHCSLKKKPNGHAPKSLCGSVPAREERLFEDPFRATQGENKKNPLAVCRDCKVRRQKIVDTGNHIDFGHKQPLNTADISRLSGRNANTLAEYFERRSRCEGAGVNGMWGKEPVGWERHFDSGVERNTLVHKASKIVVWNGFLDLINRVDQRYPDELQSAVVYFWTNRANIAKLTRLRGNGLWNELLEKYAKVCETYFEDEDANEAASSSKRGSSVLGLDAEREPKTAVVGEFLALDVETVHARAIEKKVRPSDFGDDALPGRVLLTELLTGLTYRDAFRQNLLEEVAIGVPILVPYAFLRPNPEKSFMCRVQINAYDGRPVCHVHDKLVLAAAAGDFDAVKRWLDAGADVNHRDVRGWTALHAVSDTLHDRAFREGNRKKQVIDLLIEHKADYHALTLRGEKALALAEARGFGECAELLRKEYVVPIVEDAGKGDGDGDTPLAAALKEKMLF